MRHLIWYLRTTFCNHEWDIEEKEHELYSDYVGGELLRRSTKVSATCKKCGWHRRYSKF